MSDPHPDFIDPWRAIDAGAEYGGALPLTRLSRLGEFLRGTEGQVHFRLAGSRDAQGHGVLSGEIRARLVLTCQRCLGPLEWDLAIPLSLALVSGLDEARQLPDELDPLLVSGEQVKVPDLIEDELLLALPQIPLHESGECFPPGSLTLEEGDDPADAEGRLSPFAKLGEWGKVVKG